MKNVTGLVAGLAISIGAVQAWARAVSEADTDKPAPDATTDTIDLSKPTLFVVGYAHLDTQWRWTYIDTIRDFIPNTLYRNFRLFEKYPDYIFNFGGSRRYEMMEEYYPDGFEKMKEYVKQGRWFPCGSSVDENDANVPSAESQIRHALYGNRFFRQELGIASDEFMLPDCFGFPASLPSVLAHCGIKGFSTQKLTWNAVIPIPFKVGVWEGPDGRSVIAALDPGSYSGDVRDNLANDDGWYQRIQNNGKESGVYVDYHYYGTGDVGGAPREPSVAMIEQSVKTGREDGAKIHVISSTADGMIHEITDDMRESLPTYKGELELTQHSAGSVTSEAYMKRWNRKNELLADAAEKAAVGAWWLGAGDYPAERLQRAWELVLGSQMHDILPGTSVPLAYDFAWNDEIIAANQFSAVATDAAAAIISGMDTRADGTSIVVYNPLSWDRHDVVEAEIPYDGRAPSNVTVTGPDGRRVPAQINSAAEGTAHVAFVADVPSVGFASYAVNFSPAEKSAQRSSLKISSDGRRLENEHYIVQLNDHGDVSSILDKQTRQELLSAPARIGLFYENPSQWPAWNQDWEDRQLPAKAYVGAEGPVTFKVVEDGPARVAVEVTRQAEGSTFTQRVRLGAGSDRVEFDTDVDWNTRERSVRAAFPLTASNPTATYDIQVGTLERGNARPNQYEYGFQQWFDLTDTTGRYGASVMCDSKYGCDKPDDNTVRLTLIYTPGTRGGYPDQGSQDIGRHHILYAVQGHAGDWHAEKTWQQGAQLNQPLLPFRTTSHEGSLGKSFSLVQVSDPSVSVQALKKAEDSDEVIVRLREQTGKDVRNLKVTVGDKVVSAREVDGQERSIGRADVRDDALVTDIGGYELRAYALTLAQPSASHTLAAAESTPIKLDFDSDVISTNDHRGDGAMNADGETYPAEQMPSTITVDDITFNLGSGAQNAKNALAARGQTIDLPGSGFNRVYLLAASSDGDINTQIGVGNAAQNITVHAWNGFVGQWDHREWPGDVYDPRYPWGSSEPIGLTPGFVKSGEIAHFISHRHSPAGGDEGSDVFYRYSYIYKIGVDVPEGADAIRLPDDPRIKVFAVSAARENDAHTVPAHALFDTLEDHQQGPPQVALDSASVDRSGTIIDTAYVSIEPGLYWEPGAYHYTTDGSDPTVDSPVYAGPISLSDSATVKVAAQNKDGTLGPVASRRFTIVDRTPPTVTDVLGMYESPELKISFSEPVTELDAEDFKVEPGLSVQNVKISGDGRTATVALSDAPAVGKDYSIHIAGVKDTSPAANSIKATTVDFNVPGPVFTLENIGAEQMGKSIENVEGLPVKANQPWTMNVFAKMDKQPTNHTVIVGFGECAQRHGGAGRYICKFANGIHFWSHNQDAPSTTQYDLGKWQMITATYDGKNLKLYKNGELIGERPVRFSDDQNVIHIAPADPWDHRYHFEGELSDLTIWNAALSPAAVRSLISSGPQ